MASSRNWSNSERRRRKSFSLFGPVDLVSLDLQQRPRFAVEVKWSDQPFDDPKAIKGILEFAKKHRLGRQPLVTTLSKSGQKEMQGVTVEFMPSSLHCYTVARNTLERRQNR
jgi:hypothetical protein